MITESIIDEMDLPLANPKEELETISANHFKPLFDVSLFEVRSQDYRDKGLDFQIEIKKAGRFTNFRFAVQLKATDSDDINSDGSISVQIHTSNINYLLNFGMPSYYVLYFSKSNTFFFQNINDFIRTLSEKDTNWQNQSSHVLRFKKILSPTVIDEMYESSLQKGLFQREINVKLALHSNSVNSGDKIIIGQDLSISDDKEIRELIENIGLELINEARWHEIISVHKRASGNVASSAKYNLVLGIAYYYNSHLIESLSCLNAASKQINELPDYLKKHLKYFETTVKYSIGLITQEQYAQKLTKLEEDKIIGLYVKLENAKQRYIESLDKNIINGYEKFVEDVQKLINDSNAEKSFILFAKCELILHEGSKNNMDYVKEISTINAIEDKIGPNFQTRLGFAHGFIENNKKWANNVHLLKKEATKSNNYLAFFNALINEARVIYEFYAYASIVSIEQDLPGYPKQDFPDIEPLFNEQFKRIERANEYYTNIGHIENRLVTLSLKYEMLHFLNHIDKAVSTIEEIDGLINAYDLETQKKKLQFLKDEGPTHVRFKKWVDEVRNSAKSDKLEFDEMIDQMKKMDSSEKPNKKINASFFIIQLFPIGFFQFPRSDRNEVYKILSIKSNKLKSLISDMLENGIIPVVNIYLSKITHEGFSNGNLADQGIESWRNIYKIRKAFYENEYYRVEKMT